MPPSTDRPPSRRHRPDVAVAVAAVLVVGATTLAVSCSSSDRSAAGDAGPIGHPSAAVEPCSLLTAAEIARATGWRLPKGEHPDQRAMTGAAGSSICNWEDRAVDGAVQVQVTSTHGRAAFDAHRRELTAADPAVAGVAVPGATEAYQSAGSGTVGLLVDDRFVQVSAIGATLRGAEHLALAADVARRLR